MDKEELKDFDAEIEAEKRKISQLYREIKSGHDDEKIHWMYKNPAESVDREEYLLGRSVDKALDMITGKDEPSTSKGMTNIPNRIVSEKNKSEKEQVDLHRKMLEDPLFAIRQKEIDARKKLLSNPVKMKELKMMLDAQAKKKEAEDRQKLREEKRRLKADNIDYLLVKQLKKIARKVDINALIENLDNSDSSSEDDIWVKKKTSGKKRNHSTILNRSKEMPDEARKSKRPRRTDSDIDQKKYKQRSDYSSDESDRRTKEKKQKTKRKTNFKSKHHHSMDSDTDSSETETEKRRKNSHSKRKSRKKSLTSSDESESDSDSSSDDSKYSSSRKGSKSSRSGRQDSKIAQDRRKKPKKKNNVNSEDSSDSISESESEKLRKEKKIESKKEDHRIKLSSKKTEETSGGSYSSKFDEASARDKKSTIVNKSKHLKKKKSESDSESKSESDYREKSKKKSRKSRKKKESSGSDNSSDSSDETNKKGKKYRKKNITSDSESGSSDSDDSKRKRKRTSKKALSVSKASGKGHNRKYKSSEEDQLSKRKDRRSENEEVSSGYKGHGSTKFGLSTVDGSKPDLTSKNYKPYKKKEEKSKYVPIKHVKLTEKEREEELRKMQENAKLRKKEQEMDSVRHRSKLTKEEKMEDYDKDFMRKQVAKLTSHGSMADRIKSNINNIQRSKSSMNQSFVRK